jgi:hypothetical protein
MRINMPISNIQVNEYHCTKCGYKWINGVNGRDGPIPKSAPNVKSRIGLEMKYLLDRMACEDAQEVLKMCNTHTIFG